jgi:NAD(P)-dependent dehydrogenase (short-subunit alcohol dehydrogenase family)
MSAAFITLILGGSGGLGRIVRDFFDPEERADWSRETGVWLENECSIDEAIGRDLQEATVGRLINCAGVNFLSRFDDTSDSALLRAVDVNAFTFPRVVRRLRVAGKLPAGAVLCNVISNAAHIPMTHSIAYNASKAAQEMITRQMARELKEYSIFGVSPNKLAGTPMSRQIEEKVCELRGWTAEEARAYQLAALPAGEETPPESLALFLIQCVNSAHHPYLTGCILPYGGPQ